MPTHLSTLKSPPKFHPNPTNLWQTTSVVSRGAPIKRLALALLASASVALAQGPIQHGPDGGTSERTESVYIPALPNAPFTATVVTEWVHLMPDGNKRTTYNHRLIARDSSGRVFQERRYFSPTGNTQDTQLSQLEFYDPNQHTLVFCTPNSICREVPYASNYQAPDPNASLPPLVTFKNGITVKNEDLGTGQVQGVDVLGSRTTRTIPAKLQGNEKPIAIVKEFWYSPYLAVNIITKRDDPTSSSLITFTVTNLSLHEPDRALFTPPAPPVRNTGN